MLLSQLLTKIPVQNKPWPVHGQVLGITHDSRQVAPGFIFVAIEGLQTDGHLYIPQAVHRGALAVVVQKQVDVPPEVTVVQVADTRRALPLLAAGFYDHPAQKMKMVGITGTNGKTTTSNLIDAIWREHGLSTGLIGTIHNKIGDAVLEVARTTPESSDLQSLLAQMVQAKVQVVTMEVSSHALALHRVDGCEYDVAVLTNLTQDHLDFHGNMDAYLQAKGLLFSGLGQNAVKTDPKCAIINNDDPAAQYFISQCRVPVITYGVTKDADITAQQIQVTAGGVSFTVADQGQPVLELNLKLTGMFNVYNALAAYATGRAGAVPPSVIKKALEKVAGVPGRFELVQRGQNFAVIVDYAHTPDGLANVLHTARQITTGKLITVFGCGGDRDRTKRPIMGKLAAQCSDLAVITSDNPRSEEPLSIIDDIMVGVKKVTGARYLVQPDRGLAIKEAISAAAEGDVVLIAGKGHENYQIIGDIYHHFDDKEQAHRALEQLQ